MRKILFLLILLPATMFAQTVEFGYFSLSAVLDSLPEYKTAQDNYNTLLEHCDSEVLRNEEELTRYYVSFLNGQSSFPEPILRMRQKELQNMVDRSVVLRDQLKEWLAQAHDSLFNPIINKVDKAIERVCICNNLAYAIDVDKEVYRFVNPRFGIDITAIVAQEVIMPTLVVNSAAEGAATADDGVTENVEPQPAVDEHHQPIAGDEPRQTIVIENNAETTTE